VRAALEGREPDVPDPPGADDELRRRAPVFVTVRRDGELRGCMGELAARYDDLVQETMDRARVAAFRDPRFPPLTVEELPRCTFEVTVLEPLEEVGGAADLDPAVFGVEVTDAAGRSAVLLPGIEGIETAVQQLALVRRKAGIPADEPVRVRRFRVTKIG
jgi:AmmeMemoRadiSam system protein A